MLGYVTLGTSDLQRAAGFYDVVLAEVGAKRFMEMPRAIAWSAGPQGGGLSVGLPFDGKPATVGNGVMVALAADSKEKVNAIYRKAIECGGTDEGPPGPRGDHGFYAAYFRDLDGNKLSAFFAG